MEEDSVEDEIQREVYTGHVEGLRSVGLEFAKDLLRGKNFDDVFSCFVKSIVENLLERVVDPFVAFSKAEAQENCDPIEVPVGHFDISDQLLCLPVAGVVDVAEGKISNLSSISKSDDCVVDVQGRVLFVRLKLQIVDVSYQADSTLALFCSNSAFNLKAILATIALNVELRVDFRSLSNLSAEISKFDFNAGGFDVGVTGDTLPQLLAASIKHFYLQQYKDSIQDLSLGKIKTCMERAVQKLLPLLNQCITN